MVVMTDRLSKLRKAIPTWKTKVTTVAQISLKDSVANFEITGKVLTDYGPQFTLTFFQAVCARLGVEPLANT